MTAGQSITAEWPFPTAATLGSAVRARGIEREIKARLPFADRKHLAVEDGHIRLLFENGQDKRLEAAAEIVATVLDRIDALPVLPGEVEDILTISARERLKWMKDGRLKSAGTRTVKLRGRAKAVTFHVFEPGHIEDVLDRDLSTLWRAEDAQEAAEARRRAAGKAALTRAGKGSLKTAGRTVREGGDRSASSDLQDWAVFDREGLLR